MNNPPTRSESLVRTHHRVTRLAPLLAAVAVGLAATLALLWFAHPSFGPVRNWQPLGLGWLAGLAATAVAGFALWRARRRSLALSAAETDAQLATYNRLEAATALRNAGDAMAQAQREETEQFLQTTHLAPRRGWLPALGTLTAVLAVAHLATLICWARPVPPDLTRKPAAATATANTEKKPAPPVAPTATIDWHTPESETTATAIEEVPLEAVADSSTGLRDPVLEVEVNGEHRLSQPLSDDLAKPGTHTLKTSIYLDQLSVKTYDMVSYHLTAQRIAPGSLPPTASPVQFVQVRPVREDTFVCAGGDQPTKCFNYVAALKAAQLRLMKDNFTLGHAEVRHDNSEWREENSRVGGDQSQLAGRADEVITLMTTNHYPEPILSLVRQSQPLMNDAGGKILKEDNVPALAPQGQALGCLTEVERYLKNSIKLAGANKQPPANDPFQRPKNLELKTHPLTRAGKIDALANEQSRLAGDLAAGNTNASLQVAGEDASQDAPPVNGTPGERQTQIKQRIGEFLEDPGMVSDAMKHLRSSDDLAGKSQERIDQADYAAAGEPAAEAARELRQTAAALRADGTQAAKNQLADALLQLSAAAGQVRRAAQAKSDAEAAAALKKVEDAVQEAARQLAEEARRQQDNGATNAAARLKDMAGLLQGESLKQMLAQARQTPRDAAQNGALAQRLDELAERTGQQRNAGGLSRQELARLVEQLQRTQANVKNLVSQCQNPGSAAGKASQSGRAQATAAGAAAGQSSAAQQSQFAGGGGPVQPATDNPNAHARGPEMSRADMQQAEAARLLDDLRLAGADTRAMAPDSLHLARLEQILHAAADRPPDDPKDFPALALELDPPLTGLINTLQTQLATLRRPFELAAKETSPAPPAYRAAVADYFEQVSRDYHPAKPGEVENK